MKKSKLKSLVKSARKTAEKDIRLSLRNSLTEIAGQFGEGSKKLNKDIEKGSKQLAKKLAKDIRIDKSSFIKQEDAEIIESDALTVISSPEDDSVKTKKTKAVKTEIVPSETEAV
jgi:hypothetical protein